MRFLRADHLRPEIPAERAREKAALGRALDCDNPRQDDQRNEQDAGKRVQAAQPAPIAVGDGQCRDRQHRDTGSDWPLEQDRDGLGDPE